MAYTPAPRRTQNRIHASPTAQQRPAQEQQSEQPAQPTSLPPRWNADPGSLMQRAASTTGARPGWPSPGAVSASQQGAAPPGQAVRAATPAGPRQQRATGQPLTPSQVASPVASAAPAGGAPAPIATGNPNATFGSKGLSKDAVFDAITDLRGKGFGNANDLYNYLQRDYGMGPQEIYPLYQEWIQKNDPAKWAAMNQPSKYGPAAPAPAPAAGPIQTPAPQQFSGNTGQLEQAVAASLAQGYSIADAKKGAFEKYGVNQDQWNAINWANVPGGSTGPR